jgi:hypothetical protein
MKPMGNDHLIELGKEIRASSQTFDEVKYNVLTTT